MVSTRFDRLREMTFMDLEKLLGAEAEDLLNHESKGIPKADLALPGPTFVDDVFAAIERWPGLSL